MQISIRPGFSPSNVLNKDVACSDYRCNNFATQSSPAPNSILKPEAPADSLSIFPVPDGDTARICPRKTRSVQAATPCRRDGEQPLKVAKTAFRHAARRNNRRCVCAKRGRSRGRGGTMVLQLAAAARHQRGFTYKAVMKRRLSLTVARVARRKKALRQPRSLTLFTFGMPLHGRGGHSHGLLPF